MIGRLRGMFAQPVFAGLAFAAGLAMINWPFVEQAREGGNPALFAYFFGLWALLVLFAFLISRCVGSRGTDEEPDV